MCKDIFCWLTGKTGTEHELAIPRAGELPSGESKTEILYRLAELSIPVLRDEVDFGAPDWMQTSDAYLKAQMAVYQLQIYFNYLFTKLRPQVVFTGFSQWLRSFSIIVRKIGVLMGLHPTIRSIVNHSLLFKVGDIVSNAPKKYDSTEWPLWQPAVLAHYKVQFGSQRLTHWQDRERVAEGMELCRTISFGETMFRMNSLSALQSLFISCLCFTEIHSPQSMHYLMLC